MTFPPDFLWGTATSSYQVEGQNSNSDWYAWEMADPDRIKGALNCGLACNWWANAEADLDIAAEMRTNAHRLSLEWSRIEPEPSVFDSAAIERYRAILRACHDRGLEPMVTLHQSRSAARAGSPASRNCLTLCGSQLSASGERC